MTDEMITLLIVMGEATVFFMAVLLVIIIFRIRSGISLKRSAKEFVNKIKNEGSEHRNKLKNILITEHSLDETEAESAVDNLIEQENSLYSKIIALYLGDKKTKLADINDEVHNLTQVMHEVTVSSTQNANTISELDVDGSSDADAGSDSGYLNSEVERLQKELEEVKAERQEAQDKLLDAMNTMEGMMTEYASMYSGGVAEKDLDPEKDIKKVKDKIKELKGESDSTEQTTPENEVDADLSSDAEDLDIDKDV